MEQLVLLVDDERLPIHFYVKALQSKSFAVKHFTEPDSALEFAKAKKNQVCIIILDVMMPPGRTYENKDTEEGLRTGVFLVEDLAHYYPDVPIVVLTNVGNPKTLQELKAKRQVRRVLQKMDCPPFELVEVVSEIVGGDDGQSA